MMSFSTWAPASPAPISSTRERWTSTSRRRNPNSRLWNRIAPKAMTAEALPNTTTESGSGRLPRPTSVTTPSTRTKLVAPESNTRRASWTLA